MKHSLNYESKAKLLYFADEDVLQQYCKIKRHKTKVICMEAVARLRKDTIRKQWSDEKMELQPFVRKKAARRSSIKGEKDAVKTKVKNSVDKLKL